MEGLIAPQNAPAGALIRLELRFDAGWAGRKSERGVVDVQQSL